MVTISHCKKNISIEDIYSRIDSLDDPTLPIDTLKSIACELLDTKCWRKK